MIEPLEKEKKIYRHRLYMYFFLFFKFMGQERKKKQLISHDLLGSNGPIFIFSNFYLFFPFNPLYTQYREL